MIKNIRNGADFIETLGKSSINLKSILPLFNEIFNMRLINIKYYDSIYRFKDWIYANTSDKNVGFL